ncbi:MAG TPA: Ig-like domain-containing protein [Bryobacteraceae bacterium]|nr:Ig-like domain-containing protein [Bryobacteraceae bacterium]
MSIQNRLILLSLIGACWSSSANAQVTYQYTGNPFTLFTCGGNSLCPTPGPNANSSYTPTDKVTGTLTLATSLPAGLNLQDISGLAGFQISLNDGHQTMTATAGYTGGFNAKVSTDASGNITEWIFGVNCCFYPNNGVSTEYAPDNPQGPLAGDTGFLSAASYSYPNTPYNGALSLKPGTWGPSGGSGSGGPTYGTATRVFVHDQFPGDNFDTTIGDLGIAQSPFTLYSTVGIQAAYPRLVSPTATNPYGLATGAWSETAQASGAARGLAFRNVQYTGTAPTRVRLNAVLDGEFQNAPFGLPNGPAFVGAAIHVYKASGFQSAIQASGKTASQFMLGAYTETAAESPQTVIPQLDSLFPNQVLGTGATYLSLAIPATLPVTFSTTSFQVNPQDVITVVFDVTTATLLTGFADGTESGSEAYFLDTLSPSPNLFTDDSGNPVSGFTVVDNPPSSSLPPAVGTVALSPASNTAAIGGTDTLTATVMDANNNAMPNAPVRFSVTSGPNVGAEGAGTTDASGKASFTYPDNGGRGIDTIQASVASVVSNVAQQTWQGPARCPQSPGYWKNHPGSWPVTSLNIGAQTYSQQQLLQLLGTPGGGDASMILAVQLIAAKLNIANGADRSPVASVVVAGDNLLAQLSGSLPFNVSPGSSAGSYMTQRGATLASYNGGSLTGSCVQ